MAGVRLYNHTAVAEVVRQLATMTDSELADVARRLVAQDAALAERLADEVLRALEARLKQEQIEG